LLEIAVALLGATVNAATLSAIGPKLFLAIAVTVLATLVAGVAVGRLFGLPRRMALLIATGNAICGNSAIAAVAPIICADGRDVSAAIAFTAILGIGVVVGLPLLGAGLHLDQIAYGTFAGLTVYAVPQVIAAAAPMGSLAVQVGTLVKLVRVLMLGPVCVILSLIESSRRNEHCGARTPLPRLHRLIPWFILAFLALMAARTSGALPATATALAGQGANFFTVVAMAGLGLSVDARAIARAGARASATVMVSVVALAGLALAVVRALGVQ